MRLNLDLHVSGGGGFVDPALPGRNSTRFMKYLAWLERAQGYLLERSGADAPLFPSALPYPEVVGLRWPAGGGLNAAQWGRVFVNTLVAWSNFVVLGCPGGEGSAFEPRVAHRSVEGIRPYADKLLGEVANFVNPEVLSGTLSCEGKRRDLEDMVASGTGACYSGVMKVDDQRLSTALPVVADRVAIPEEAGQVDPRECLNSVRAQVVDRLHELRKPEPLWGEEVQACHRVPVQEETPLLRRLLAAKMITLLPESVLPCRQDGRMLLGGLFSVRKNEKEDRLIFDRRPENATMDRLDWARLPAGACFCRLLLADNEILRGSGDDLRNYYYTLALPPDWVRFNGFGRRVARELVAEAGLDPTVPHRACLRVLGMGDINGCAIAQATHEAVLQKEGLLLPDSTLVYGEPVPKGRVWQGAYLDDLLITYRMLLAHTVELDGTFEAPKPSPQDPDVMLTAAAERAYLNANLSRAEHKAFRCETEFKAWGAEVDGVKGRAGAPLAVRRQVWQILRKIVALGFCTKEILQRVLGFVCFIFQYRREFYSLQHHIYKYIEGIKGGRWVRLPNHIVDELRSIALHLPLAVWQMRKEISPELIATDATPTSGGATAAQISPELAQELWRRSEIRGAPVRLDRTEDFSVQASMPKEPSKFASSLCECLRWHVIASYSFRQTSHINLQELRAFKREVCRVASHFSPRGRVQLFVNDSNVTVGATAKGRSSSFKVNGLLRTLVPFLLFGDVTVAMIWIETESNPADHPSRFTSVPPPRTAPTWMRTFGVPGPAVWGLEIFAGAAGLTKAHCAAGCPMHPAVKSYEGRDVFDPVIDQMIVGGLVQWIWLSPPASSFSPLRNLAATGPLRPSDRPEGDEHRPEVRKGNLLWRRAVHLARLANQAGAFFALEHPASSRAWLLPETRHLCSRDGVNVRRVNWCAYRDVGLGGGLSKGSAKLCFTLPWMLYGGVLKTCPGNHAHSDQQLERPLRGRGDYPSEFCEILARALGKWSDGATPAGCGAEQGL